MKDGYRIAYDRASLDLAGKLVEIEQLKRRRGQLEALVQALTLRFSQVAEVVESRRQPFSPLQPSVSASVPAEPPVPQHREQPSHFDLTRVDTSEDPIQARIEMALGKKEVSYNATEVEEPVTHFERPRLFAFVS